MNTTLFWSECGLGSENTCAKPGTPVQPNVHGISHASIWLECARSPMHAQTNSSNRVDSQLPNFGWNHLQPKLSRRYVLHQPGYHPPAAFFSSERCREATAPEFVQKVYSFRKNTCVANVFAFRSGERRRPQGAARIIATAPGPVFICLHGQALYQ